MVLGKSPKLPGQLLRDPGPPLNTVETRALLDQLYKLHDKPGIPTSARTEELDISFTNNATHVYIKVSKPESLCAKFEGPYRIHSRPSRSTIEVELGKKKDGSLRLSTYHWSSAKVAHMREGAVVAERPKLGRPPKRPPQASPSSDTNNSELSNKNSSEEHASDSNVNTTDNQQSVNNQPITADTRSPSRPIRARKRKRSKPAKIQTAKQAVHDPDTGRNVHPDYLNKGPLITKEMFDKWTPSIVGANGQSSFSSYNRPVRSTRNVNPSYVDAMVESP